MSILRDLIPQLQAEFSDTTLGRKRSMWFVYTLLAVVVPFTTSITSNLLRALRTLFGLELESQRFYGFMASPTLPWKRLWHRMWDLIPQPTTEGRLLLVLDDFINPKTGSKIFACGSFFDHAAKANQSSYPWSQNVVSLGLLKWVKGRWACLPLAFRFYVMEKDIAAGKVNVRKAGKVLSFESKMVQAAEMIRDVFDHYKTGVLVVTDSWFGNDGLWKRLARGQSGAFHLLSRLRSNNTLYDLPSKPTRKRRGAPRKYGERLGNTEECAATYRERAKPLPVHLYGKQRVVLAFDRVVTLKTLKCPVHVVWVFRQSQFVALFTTDLSLSVQQIIEYYGARWKIESGFKEIKREIGSAKSQTRNAFAVTNHLHFCMMAATLTWIYADRIKVDPERRHKVKGRTSFAFSDVRRLIAEAALDPDFQRVCPNPRQTPPNSFVETLLRMVA
jgi:hypothetical protein